MKRLLIILTLAGLPCAPFAQTRLTLDACIEQAEANNKALAAADRQLAAAQFDFRSARANFFPSFSATGTGLYSTADGGLDIAGGALPVLGVDGMPTGGTALFPGLNLAYEVGWVYGGGITLEQPLYMGGKVRTGYRMARIGSEMAEQNRRLTRSEVIVSTSRAYASVIRAREMRQVAERYHALLTELLRSVESARKHGLKPQNDVLKVRVKLNESELNLRRTENALRLATMNLCHLIGRPLTDRIEVADDLPDLPSTPVPAVDLMARPEYRLLDRKAELAREQLRLARSERLPQVGLVGNYGYLHGGATIALLETVASIGTEQNTDFDKERPFGIDVQVRHRKSGKEGTLRGVADLDREEVSERTGAVKQYWNVAAYDDAGDVVSDGVIMTKIVSLARLAQKEQERTS